jgi:hypothetical protein
MSLEDFVTQLRESVGDVSVNGTLVSCDYVVPVGRFAGNAIRLGFDVPPTFPAAPPGGPHVSPPLIKGSEQGATHQTRSHRSRFGDGWEYWSRPYPQDEWRRSAKTVRVYMAYVRQLLNEA